MAACNALWDRLGSLKSSIERRLRDAAVRRELRAELTGLGRGDLDRVLADIGISRDEMEAMIRNATHSRMLLGSMLRRLDLDRPLSLATPEVVREIERRCATCDNPKQCGDWLNKGAPGDAYRGFCPNATAFDNLSRADKAA